FTRRTAHVAASLDRSDRCAQSGVRREAAKPAIVGRDRATAIHCARRHPTDRRAPIDSRGHMTPKKKSGKKIEQRSKKASRKQAVPRKKKGPASRKKKAANRAGRGRPQGGSSRRAWPREGEFLERSPSPDNVGLSNTAGADSESVDELLDEGNALEAGVVSG